MSGLSPAVPMAPSGETSFPITATTSRMAASRSTEARPNAEMSASMPICRKNTGMNRWPTGVSSRRMRSAWSLRLRAMPATNAPTMGASLAMSASSAKARVNASAMATIVPVERDTLATARNRGGATRMPTTTPTTRKATAPAMMPATDTSDTEPSVTSRTTTVSTTRPMTSSATAAPSTTRASVVAMARRSLNTRAVMPTLVAVSAAPMNSATLKSSEMKASIAPRPRTSGVTTPTTATRNEARPTRPSSTRSISRPTSSSRRMTPISPSVWSTSSPWSTSPRTEGPIRMPATISPTTAGMPARSASSAASLAATSTTRMLRSTSATSIARFYAPRAGTVGPCPPGGVFISVTRGGQTGSLLGSSLVGLMPPVSTATTSISRNSG